MSEFELQTLQFFTLRVFEETVNIPILANSNSQLRRIKAPYSDLKTMSTFACLIEQRSLLPPQSF